MHRPVSRTVQLFFFAFPSLFFLFFLGNDVMGEVPFSVMIPGSSIRDELKECMIDAIERQEAEKLLC